MTKTQKRVRDREITRMQEERRRAKRDGRSSEEIVVDVEKAVRKGCRATAARTIRTPPPTETTAAALAELVSDSAANVRATAPEFMDLTAEAESDWSAEREELASIYALALPSERHGLWGKFLIWLNLLAVRIRLRFGGRQKDIPKVIA